MSSGCEDMHTTPVAPHGDVSMLHNVNGRWRKASWTHGRLAERRSKMQAAKEGKQLRGKQAPNASWCWDRKAERQATKSELVHNSQAGNGKCLCHDAVKGC